MMEVMVVARGMRARTALLGGVQRQVVVGT
jgi:hypothetical protein